MLEIPLSNSPDQQFRINLDNERYDIEVVYNTRSGIWHITISRAGTRIIDSVAMLGGIDIFNPYNIPIRNAYVVDENNNLLDPTRETFGVSVKLFILTDAEEEQIG